MANMKEIKNRIKSVSSTMQITKAMELVASSKLRHAKERAIQSAPYFETLYATMSDIVASNRDFSSTFMQMREVKNSLVIVIAGDRGLAGGYNTNVLKSATSKMADKNARVITIGKKSTDFFSKSDVEIVSSHDNFAENVDLIAVNEIISNVTDLYKKGEIDEVYVAYTQFVSPLIQTPSLIRVLPVEGLEAEPVKSNSLTEYDPSPEVVFDLIIPKYISGILYGAIIESYASEQAARRVAMESASDNASDMIDDLSLLYNRARQGAITQEISEIVAGSGSQN
ncbi:MAG: ATP synthase F1 subunit gamma [Clostridia bacterium]